MRPWILAGLLGMSNFAPVTAEPATWERLVGRKVHLTINQVRRVKVEEDGGVYTDHHNWQFEVMPGPDGAIRYWRKDTGT